MPFSVLPCFSKVLEKVIYNKLHNYLTKSNILFSKQLGFWAGHSTGHAAVKLLDEITNGFIENKYTLGVFIDLSKAFNTVNHSILLEKLHLYRVGGKTFQWFESYLSHRKQYLVSSKESTSYQTVLCKCLCIYFVS